MIEYGSIIRDNLLHSFQGKLKTVRILANIDRSELAERSGIGEDVIAALENGVVKITPMQYLTLASCITEILKDDLERQPLLNEIMLSDLELLQLPQYYVINLKRLFKTRSLSDRWFLTFTDAIEQLSRREGGSLTDYDVEFLVSNYKIFLDETILDNEKFECVMDRLASDLRMANAAVIVPLCAVNAVKESLYEAGTTERANIESALDAVNDAQDDALLKIMGNDEDVTENTLRQVFVRFKDKYRFALLTANYDFAFRMKALSSSGEWKAPILVGNIDERGDIYLYDDVEDSDSIPQEPMKEFAEHLTAGNDDESVQENPEKAMHELESSEFEPESYEPERPEERAGFDAGTSWDILE